MKGYNEYLRQYIAENTTNGFVTMYWDYRDEVDKDTLQQYINSILLGYTNDNDTLYETIYEEIGNNCDDYLLENNLIQELINNAPTEEIMEHLQNSDYSTIIDDLEECGYNGVDYNIDQLLRNTYINVNILFGTDVERNYDMSSIVTAFGNDYQYPFTDYAMPSVDNYDNAFTYLIHQQGHTVKEILSNRLNYCKEKSNSEFIKGAVTDIENNSSEAMSELGVYIQLNGNDILEFCNKLQEGKGWLVFDKDTNISLFNEWSGTCGYPDNYLEKDFVIPVSMIRNVQIEGARSYDLMKNEGETLQEKLNKAKENNDSYSVAYYEKQLNTMGRNGYTIDEVCGLIGSFWKEDAVTYTDKAPELLSEDVQASLNEVEQAYSEINKEHEMEIE